LANLNYSISSGRHEDVPTTELGESAFRGLTAVVDEAIRNRIDWKEESTHPLFGAILGGHAEIAERLLNAGSPVDQHILVTALSQPALFHRLFMKPNLILSLKQKERDELLGLNPVPVYNITKLLLENGANPNSPEARSPLHEAAKFFNQPLAELYLQHGADINALDFNSRSPLQVMARSGNSPLDLPKRKRFYDFLVAHGAVAIPPFTSEQLALVQNGKYI
jgi:hypothetical protein